MRIGMVLPKGFPPDIRVEKEIKSLLDKHEVHLLCTRHGKQAATEDWQGAQIHRVFSTPERWLENFRLTASCHSPGWQRQIDRFTAEIKPDVLHIHDLPLLGPALRVRKKRGVPVVADLHENYPEMLATQVEQSGDARNLSLGILTQRIFLSVEKWRRYEAAVVPRADQVVVVIEEARDRLIELGVAPERISVVPNYASLDEMISEAPSEDGSHAGGEFRIVYVGSFGPTRDLDTVVEAAALLKDDIPGLRVQMVGGVGQQVSKLEAHAAQKGVADRVEVLAWRPSSEVAVFNRASSVCLVPHVKSPQTDATIPHKLFQYMAARKPIVVSNCAPLERLVNDSGCGLAYTSGNARELASCLLRLYKDPAFARSCGERGFEAVRDTYNWEAAARVLDGVYSRPGIAAVAVGRAAALANRRS